MRKYKAPPPMAQIDVTVVRAEDGRPLHNAAVIFHSREEDKNDGNMELKTNEEGKASLSLIPIGSKVMVQVIVPGYRTFGQEYDVPASEKTILVKMLPPNEQYSIYSKNPSDTDVRSNLPQTQQGQAAPHDSPLLQEPQKKKKE